MQLDWHAFHGAVDPIEEKSRNESHGLPRCLCRRTRPGRVAYPSVAAGSLIQRRCALRDVGGVERPNAHITREIGPTLRPRRYAPRPKSGIFNCSPPFSEDWWAT